MTGYVVVPPIPPNCLSETLIVHLRLVSTSKWVPTYRASGQCHHRFCGFTFREDIEAQGVWMFVFQ